MTPLGDPCGAHSEGPEHRPEALAAEIADAVDSLTLLWSVAAQAATLRLSVHQLRALRALDAEPGLNLTGLAERLETGLPTASRLCDRLEAAGLMERALHPRKRREVRLSLTRHGRRALDDVAVSRTHALAAVLGAMKPAERNALRRGMRAFLAAREATLSFVGADAEET
ncbi:MarR family winged helix-turn-helix transcriptional regulator [Streptomyces sp. NPDC057257]|uniref:MarR family winged helix-turn-helix transcriptional regulator n=1 Tax=Streptomyces sp. NPDC057257 TaxID=3346071 RepID=UPI003638F673